MYRLAQCLLQVPYVHRPIEFVSRDGCAAMIVEARQRTGDDARPRVRRVAIIDDRNVLQRVE